MISNDFMHRRIRAQRGQTLLIALIVLFTLLFLGGIFVARIAHNLTQSGRSRDTGAAEQLAQAGLNYCNQQLNTSPLGADWRPVPSTPVSLQDPDFFWLQRGFSRILMNGGRVLVRVGYAPNTNNPVGSSLVIESVGRPGALPNPAGSDPTVFVPTGNSPQLRSERVAYKQIGLTDYALYVTGKTRRTVANYIGTPAIGHPVATVLGNPMIGFAQYAGGSNNGTALFGYPVYVNGDLDLGSDTYLYESHRGGATNLNQENVFVNGNIKLDPGRIQADYSSINDAAFPAYLNEEIDQPPVAANGATSGAILASSSALYNTFQGIVRDASGQPDVNGVTRDVPRLDPPSLSTTVSGSGVLRYRALTRDSGFWYTDSSGVKQNTGEDGYGTGIYVNNFADLQKETAVAGVNGGYSERADWLNPSAHYATSVNGVSYGWNGPYYRAPGVQIDLLGNTIQLTRDDGQQFTLPDGTRSNTLTIPLWDYARVNTILPNGIHLVPLNHNGDDAGPNSPFGDPNSYGVSLVLFAEGNVRVQGVYGAITNVNDTAESATVSKLGRVHLTIVSGGTAYIDGNVVSGDGYVSGGTVHMEHASTLAIMAKDYVCVNTTQFMRQRAANLWTSQNQDSSPPFYTELGNSGTDTLDTTFSWGINPGDYTVNGAQSPLFLMMRHGALGSGIAPFNLLVNPALAANPANAYFQFPFNTVPSTAPAGGTYGVQGQESLGYALAPGYLGTLLTGGNQLPANTQLPALNQPGYDNLFRIQFDRSAELATNSMSDLQQGSIMAAPLDIRIEASLYAENRSFFVIPGYSFNPDAADSRDAYQLRGNIRISYNQGDIASLNTGQSPTADRLLKDVYPFYDEPNDVRITMFGSIAENYTASAGDQAAWMRRWGYIPDYYGSTQYYTNTAYRVQVPDMHLLNQDPLELLPGEDITLTYTTPLERQNAAQLASAQPGVPITNGLRYEYNPILAMPYLNPTDMTLIGNQNLSQQRAIRANFYSISVPSATGSTPYTYRIEQILPALPDLPVCPNYLYAGKSSDLIGSLPGDTDQTASLRN